MKIEKRKSGSYRVRKMCNGKVINLTFDHKPKQSEILEALSDKLAQDEVVSNDKLTFRQAAEKYTDMKRNVLSPSTIRDYVKYPDRLSEWFVNMNLYDINQIAINKQVNELSSDKSPKTVRNYHGFISAVLGTFRPDMKISTTLPQKRKYEPYAPSKEDVSRILEYVRAHEPDYYIPLCLACYGLRRGETCALTPDDIEGDVIHITKSKAMNENKEWVVKCTKTTSGERDVIIPEFLAEMIRNQGYVFNGHPNQILKCLQRVQTKLEIPKFSLHMLRHYFAAVLSETCDEATVLELGGWQSDHVMKRVYRYSLTQRNDEKKRDAMKKIQNSIGNLS